MATIAVPQRKKGAMRRREFGIRNSEFGIRKVRSFSCGDATRTGFGVSPSETLRERGSEFGDATRMEFGVGLNFCREKGFEIMVLLFWCLQGYTSLYY
jgi:hypothetical protein